VCHELEALANGEKEVGGNGEPRLEVLEDEGLVLQLVPLGRRERRPHRRRRRRRNAHGCEEERVKGRIWVGRRALEKGRGGYLRELRHDLVLIGKNEMVGIEEMLLQHINSYFYYSTREPSTFIYCFLFKS